ncbi:PAS domain-containing protein [Novosphingobium sp. PhB165]|uniref:PAS domain-containing protein n=1 Tax=Novosphingobium sp. PhB165 TaxID=2485105 RepID=UPI0014048352|nr:PAS domain-containing protein [Novosphingobium sp. PhB165]
MLYALVLLIADDGTSRLRPSRWAYPCAVLAVISFLINHGGGADTDEMLRLVASLAAVTIAALLLARNRRLREKVRASDLRYETIFNSLALAIWEHDFTQVMAELNALKASGVDDLEAHLRDNPGQVAHLCGLVRITHANDAAMRLLGRTGKAGFFEHLSDFLPEEDKSFVEGLLALGRRSPTFETECLVRGAQGELIPIFIAMRLPTDGNGYDRVCGSVLDLTERKRMEKNLEAARLERDEALHRAIIGGLSTSISHEVSQPLSSINAYLAAARRWLDRRPPDLAEARRVIAQAQHAGEDATQVIAQVHEVVERGRLERSLVPFAPLIRRAAEAIRTRHPTTSFDLTLGDGNEYILGEVQLLERLVSSLIGGGLNASHCPEEQRAIRIATSADGSYVRLNITCSAFTEPAVPWVSDRQPAHLSAGGLSLCRAIAQFHGGSIRVTRNGEGTGIDIELELPRACDEE